MVPEVVRNGPGHPSRVSTPIHRFVDRSICHGRYQWLITINLRENTVDIDGQSSSTYGRIRSISTVDHDQPTREYGRYRRSITIHLLRIGSIVDSGRSIEGVGSVDFIDDTCEKLGPHRECRGAHMSGAGMNVTFLS